jgi:hypothetical protein
MEIVAIPPTTPPAIAPAFELLPFGGVGVGVGVPVELEDALADDVYTPDTIAEVVDSPVPSIIAPGPYSGLSIWNVSGRRQRREEREHKETTLTTSGIRFSGVPIALDLERVVIMVLFIKRLKTNRDIQHHPMRDTYLRRDRVWETGNKIQCQMQ